MDEQVPMAQSYVHEAEIAIQGIVHDATMHGLSARLPVNVPPHADKSLFMKALRQTAQLHAHDARDTYLLTKKRSWRYLASGFIFLIFCLLVGYVAQSFLGARFGIGRIIEESATVAGWVGMWRPVEMFLYELPELKSQQKLYAEIYQHILRLNDSTTAKQADQ